MSFSRRDFLKTAAASVGALIAPGVLLRARPAHGAGADRGLVALFLRGGADWLKLVVPHADPAYYAARPSLAVAPGTELDLDGSFGLHPSLAPLLPYFRNGRLAVVHACGSPDETRSHFDAMDFMESAAPGDKSQREGWLNRFLIAAGLLDPLHAVTLESRAARALQGARPTLSVSSIRSFKLDGGYVAERSSALSDIYADRIHESDSLRLLGPAMDSMNHAIEVLQSLDLTTPVAHPATSLGNAMRDVAAMIKGNIGLRVAAVSALGWDHHEGESRRLPVLADELGSSLASFDEDLGAELDRTLVLVMTEFGRRVAENGSNGTDHGHGGAMLALGGAVARRRVLLRDDIWPGLEPSQRFQGNDLTVTTDFRHVFGEILARHMGLSDLSPVFPNHTADPARFAGLFV
jgi:uncharacterized protein (DUF1501 family)